MRLLRRSVAILGTVLVAVALLMALHGLSAWIVRAHLRHEAEARLSALQAGQPLWQWTTREPRDLVAGRPFGAATAKGERGALRVTSRDGSPFEVGLPVMRPLDLAHWPLLRLDIDGLPGDRFDLAVQSDKHSPACLASGIGARDSIHGRLLVDLRRLAWHTEDGRACPPPRVVTYMLRLRMTMTAGSSALLKEAAFLPLATQVPDQPEIALPGNTVEAERDLAVLARQIDPPAAPRFLLAPSATPEQWLGLRDRILHACPGAVIAVGTASIPAVAQVPAPTWLGWAICAFYVAALIWLGIRSTDRSSPGELPLIMAGPLWLIAGLQWGWRPSMPGLLAFMAALLYAAWAEWRRRPNDWRWLGHSWRDWVWPLALLPVAWGWGAWSGHGFTAPDPRHAATYLAWAALQQWLMLTVALRGFERWRLPPAARVLATAALFALLHTPNHLLMQLCLLAELWWGWCFVRSRALLPIALAHASAALLVESAWVGATLRSLEVSARFFL
jgi:hypothetical protein